MRTPIAAFIVLALTVCAEADSYHVDWSSVNCGGGQVAGGPFRINCTIGQPAVSFVKAANLLHWIGFWAEEMPSPTAAVNIADIKLMSDGVFVSTSGKIATSAVDDFAQFFYIEDLHRTNGIRVTVSLSSIDTLARGSVVNVIGTLGTTTTGERQIVGPIVIITATAPPLAPLGSSGRSLSYGAGLDNTGLLVMTWGRVTSTGLGYVEIDDGSGPMRVDTSALVSQPAKDSYISVIGIASLYESSGQHLRLILPQGSDSIASH